MLAFSQFKRSKSEILDLSSYYTATNNSRSAAFKSQTCAKWGTLVTAGGWVLDRTRQGPKQGFTPKLASLIVRVAQNQVRNGEWYGILLK